MTQLDQDVVAQIVRTSRFFLDRNYTGQNAVTPAQIEAAATEPMRLFLKDSSPEETAAYLNEVRRQLSEGVRIQIAEEKILVEQSYVDWYVGDRLRTRPLWDRYQRYLAFERLIDGKTIASINRSSDRIVSQLGDPTAPSGFDRRGLVVGQVQSGKTTSYCAVVNKAVDAGYRVIVILTGIHESLRVQTQKRIEEGVRGLATDSKKPSGPRKDDPLPLARLSPIAAPPHMFTTRAFGGDFSGDAKHFANVVEGTQIFVVKKNAKILGHLRKFFETASFQRVDNEIIGRPLLVIDDESDNASIDIRKPDASDESHDPSAINREIRRLLKQFRQRAYVGYTATPYANILIHRDNRTNDAGPDLFPKDFIVMLPPPSNYVGPGIFFGATDTSGTQPEPPPLLRMVDDCGSTRDSSDWMPLAHDKQHVPQFEDQERIPDSLEEAVLSFLVSASVRKLRGWAKTHNSMLIHVSRFKSVQRRVAGQVETFLYALKGELDGVSKENGYIPRLRELYSEDYLLTADKLPAEERGAYPEFELVRVAIRDLLDDVELRVVNSEAQTELDYDEHPNGLSVICVGGDKLSRGLTLEGLCVSYFLRSTRMYDTLMQMGRWFGYRPGYKDLCRLYLTSDLAKWYAHVTQADEELRAEFQVLEDENARPSDFGLRVKSHPTLMVTAPAKMNSADEFDLDFGGRVSQTIHFFRDANRLNANALHTSTFLEGIAPYRADSSRLVRRDPKTGAPQANQPLPGFLFEQVPITAIISYLRRYRFHEEARRIAGEQLLEFLSGAQSAGAVPYWSVLVASRGGVESDRGSAVELASGMDVLPIERAVKPEVQPEWDASLRDDPIVLGVLSSPTDLIADLHPEEVERYSKMPLKGSDGAEQERVARNRACRSRDESRGLLVIYAIRPHGPRTGPTSGRQLELEPGAKLPIGFAIALPKSSKLPSVRYVVNSVFLDSIEQRFERAVEERDT